MSKIISRLLVIGILILAGTMIIIAAFSGWKKPVEAGSGRKNHAIQWVRLQFDKADCDDWGQNESDDVAICLIPIEKSEKKSLLWCKAGLKTMPICGPLPQQNTPQVSPTTAEAQPTK